MDLESGLTRSFLRSAYGHSRNLAFGFTSMFPLHFQDLNKLTAPSAEAKQAPQRSPPKL